MYFGVLNEIKFVFKNKILNTHESKIFKFVVYTEKKKKRRRASQIKMKKKISIIKILFRNFIVKETYLGNDSW